MGTTKRQTNLYSTTYFHIFCATTLLLYKYFNNIDNIQISGPFECIKIMKITCDNVLEKYHLNRIKDVFQKIN